MASNLPSKIQCDVMISFNSKDLKFTQKIAEKIEEQGWTVWYTRPEIDPVEALSKKGEAILSCKMFVMIISKDSCKDSQFADELALAYISYSTIYPVSLEKFRDISPLLEGGMKLMLARINWTFFFKPEIYETSLQSLLASMSDNMSNLQPQLDPQYVSESGDINFHGMNVSINFDTTDENNYDEDDMGGEDDEGMTEHRRPIRPLQTRQTGLKYDFWDRNFDNKSEVPWVEFKKKFEMDYHDKIVKQYSEDRFKFFVNLIYKDIFDLQKTVKKSQYDAFCEGNPDADMHRFYNRLQAYATGYHAMVEVFNMSSSLRLTTIQNLGNFSFPAVVQGLSKMLKDADPNIRAVATIALAKSAKNKKATVDRIMGMLDDEDRLVRESACLALGFLKPGTKAEEVVADKWRNDPIKHVREAAEVALKRMGGDHAAKCMQVTKVLASEMEFLKHSES
ncbi:uncharacterized protein LOC127713101 [Mytilus californianus]|uniref:uncharacterized protein LOC127713101 n=1 Tax=Mytilus californianus TaxID=6549 RepID=UPI00224849B5|nr:uncharacterized protein LOC127713101 [Mytilus californianus]XP_052075691.1 uncharacterized protein LOC127713101 [Mytilus californianus]XP_052075692.1 uncharacterized protein LOC127713101 [Mytilus californianus]XP_052075693.1 uncharacterized protein LOC127713101 [Mytilus californianus]XP_052075694.1 uncharacterized protein LOC127713101 [Mytilus californianus]XP_052075695.1 uncharacterized protein LOC127713101 [Mytilus californianus]